MRAIPLHNIIAFVEGQMERLFINNNFSYVEIIEMKNGKSWTIETMCDQLRKKYRVRNGNPDSYIVWIDREKQNCTNDEYRAALERVLVSEGVSPDKISIFVPNMMTENMILADHKVVREYFLMDDYRYNLEGVNGKHALKMMFKDNGEHYKETIDGVSLLKKCRVKRAADNSESVRSFYESLPKDCWWVGG